jgi:long-chain fatty acid transport protein
MHCTDDAPSEGVAQRERPMRCGLAVCSAFAVASLSASSAAHAGAFAIRTQSAYGQGLSFAGVAAGGSLSSMFWNPANLSDVERIGTELVASGIFPEVNVKLEPRPLLGIPGSNEGNIAHNALVPAAYAAYRLNELIVLGLGVNVPFGLATEYDDDSILHQTGIAGKSEVFSLNVNPAVSVQVTDWLAMALGAQVQYLEARLTRQALGALGPSTLDGDDVGVGLTAGIKVVPLAGTEIGLGYRSSIQHDLDGTLDTANAGMFDVHYKGLNLPDIVTVGIRQRVTDRVRVMAGAEWANWSQFNTVDIEGAPASIELPFEYDDGWLFSLGGEVDVTERVTLRTGIGYELSPIDDNVRNYRLPYNDGILLSAGASYRLGERLSFDLGYTFFSVEDMDILAADEGGREANGPFSGRADTEVHYVAAAIKWKL